MKISCECGKEIEVPKAQAGLAIACECGRTVVAPRLSQFVSDSEPPVRPPRRQISRRKKLVFTVVTLAVLALPGWFVLEIIYRTVNAIPLVGGVIRDDEGRELDESKTREFISLFRRSENPVLFYEPNPGGVSGNYSVNSAGFRDREFPVAKDASTFRIAILGDSIVWGHGLRMQDTFVKQLETILNENSKRPFEVMNFGVSGYSTQQEVELYRVKAKAYDPDLVIVGYCLNDFLPSSVERERFKRLYHDVFSKSYLFDQLKHLAEGVSYNQFGYLGAAPEAQFDLREQFRLLTQYCDDRRNLVVIFPILENFDSYLYMVDHRRIQDALEGLKYETLDLLDVYAKHDADALVLEANDRTHPNALGSRLAAQAIFKRLAHSGLVPIDASAASKSAHQ